MLTVLIPCKNEVRHIEACIASARLLGGEILVADSGSTDGTLDIVASMPDCRLIRRPFTTYADFKNWAIPQAGRPWVFVLDADERVTPELADEVRQTLEAGPEHIYAYRVRRRTFFLGYEARFGPWLNDGPHRLFLRDKCRYAKCRVHEELVVDKRRRGLLRNKLLHYTVNSYDEYFAKYVNYTRYGAAEQWDNGKRTSPLKMFMRPALYFLWLYFARGGFLDKAIGLHTCMLQAFFVTFVKQARLWELEHGRAVSDDTFADVLPFTARMRRAA
jgi:glycosyltransferase involved in cell wall biosynthesis